MGEALARRLHAQRHPLFLSARRPDALARLAAELDAPHRAADILDPADTEAVVSEAGREDGIAGLCFAVGTIVVKPLRASGDDDFVDAFMLNALAAARAVRLAEPALRKARGSVVLFSTVAVRQGFPNHTVIAAAKGAVEGLGRALAAELAPDIRVNVVAPSLTRTPLSQSLTANEQLARGIAQLHALNRLGEPDDPAALAAFLLGPDSGWITGQVIGVDGGRSSLRTKG
jgi:NAD(P)-dependent dehydrogenase (short-subunit alcohol dehydrogenase family)